LSEILPAIAATAPGADPDWAWAAAAHVAALSALGRHDEAAQLGVAYHEAGEREGLGSANSWVVVPTAGALVAAGRAEEATCWLDAHVAALASAGITGLRLGIAYESRAYAAIALGDQAGFNRFAADCASEYRRSKNSTLIASYQRLVRAADASAIAVAAGLDGAADFTTMSGRVARTTRSSSAVARVSACIDARERARTVLTSLLEPGGSTTGYLYAVRAGKLELVACLPEGTSPPGELTGRIARYVLEPQAPDAGTMTQHVVEQTANVFSPLPLTTVLDGRLVVAAVAALGCGQGNRVPEPAVISALASLLVQHRDVDPVTCVS
jgi:hypothetical protein